MRGLHLKSISRLLVTSHTVEVILGVSSCTALEHEGGCVSGTPLERVFGCVNTEVFRTVFKLLTVATIREQEHSCRENCASNNKKIHK
jgi:hypothetical protein